jgi:hypothetical protein
VRAPADDREIQQKPAPRGTAPKSAEETESAHPSRPINPAALQRLQGSAGNRAVSRMLGARKPAPARTPAPTKPVAAATAAAPSAPTSAPTSDVVPTVVEAPSVQRLAPGTAPAHRAGPQADPKFSALKADIKSKQHTMAKHAPPKAEADAAQGAAKPPQDDKEAQGKTANAEKMNAAKPGEFNKAAFIKAVNDAIAAQAPQNLNEAQEFGSSGKAAAVKGQVQGKVSDGKKASAGQIESTTKAAPDTSKAVEKPVTPLKPDQPPPTPGTPNPANAVPDKAPASATDFSAGPAQVNDEMAQANVTEEQLAKSNEPEFKGALDAKKEGEQHSATAPGVVRAAEDKTLAGAKAQAAQTGATAMTALTNDRKIAGAKVASDKEGAKSKDEIQRAQVTAKLQKVFDATKTEVEGILSNLDKQVDEKFSRDEKAARDRFTAEHKRKMDEYKDKRYSGISGKLRWVKDKFAGLPEEANQIFVQARQGYVTSMQVVISGVADLIGGELNKAKARIATGRAELQAEVGRLPKDLQTIGKEAAGGFSAKFDELTESVDSKGSELVNTLASKYSEALTSVDQEIDAEKEKNKGLIAQAIGAVKGVIDTILKLKDLLLGVLAKAASAVMAIIKDPIGFLGNLVSAVGAGLKNFMANIGEHLKKGLIGWLMGSMAEAGIELPEKFDLRGIVKMIASMLGLTWDAIKARIISRGVPPMAMEAVEKTVPVAQKLQSEGIGGIWEEIKEKVGDLKENLFSKISEYLIPTILTAGITWIISLLNPASAFVKACKMIIDIVTFIVERGAQIIEFVNSVLDAVIAIAGGGSGGVPALIEKALAKSVPVLIGALAAILGVGGIANKVKSFFQSLSKPVMKAVEFVVDKIVGFGRKIWSKMKATGKKIGGQIKDKFTGKDKAKDQSRQGGEHEPTRPQTQGPIQKTEPFSMSGKSHTLTATLTGSRLRVIMASTPGDLKKKAEAAETSLHSAHKDTAASELAAFVGRYTPRMDELERSKQTEENKKLALEQLTREMAADLVAIGTKHNLKDLGSYTALGLNEIELNRMIYDALGIARGAILGSRDTAAKTPSKDDEELQVRFDRMMHTASASYRRASAARLSTGADVRGFRGNVFAFASSDYFVDHQNNYILPDARVGANRGSLDGKVYVSGRPAIRDAAELNGDPTRALIERFAYNVHRHTSGDFASLAQIAAHGGPIDPVAGTMFLAAMIAEAERNPNAHVTNLLLIQTGGDQRFYDQAPMTGGGTDKPDAPRDHSLADLPSILRLPPAQVTNAEISLIRQRYEARQGMPMADIVAQFGADYAKDDLVKFLKNAGR